MAAGSAGLKERNSSHGRSVHPDLHLGKSYAPAPLVASRSFESTTENGITVQILGGITRVAADHSLVAAHPGMFVTEAKYGAQDHADGMRAAEQRAPL